MTPEIGLFALILALAIALAQASLPLLYRQERFAALATLVAPAAALIWLCVSIAFGALICAYVDSDFTVANVAANSNTAQPLLYKIAAAWGNHEGSMLLWVWVLSLYGFALALLDFGESRELQRLTLAVQGAVAAGFLLFILTTSSPFERIFPPPPNGEELNPLLQDIGLALHPPLLYLGYVGFSIVYAMAVAALIQGKLERRWGALARPWILITWSFLTLGIGMGSWWAYRELGWGGWWFWDPVENASLLPWLAGTALLHSVIVLEKRGSLKGWVLLLSIITFSLSLIGTFLVRSGIITSVHSFASDPDRGLFILSYLVAITGGALLLYGMRAPRLSPENEMAPVSREGSIVANNLLMLTLCATVLLGTLYPLLLDLFAGRKVSVGPPYFNKTFFPLIVPVIVLAGFSPLLPWQKASLGRAVRRLRHALLATLCAGVLMGILVDTSRMIAGVGIALAAWLATSTLTGFIAQMRLPVKPPLPRYGVWLAHLGVALLLLGIIGSGLWQRQHESPISAGQSIDISGFRLTYEKEQNSSHANYLATQGSVNLTRGKENLGMLSPEYRYYPVRQSTTSEADIRYHFLYDLYAVIAPGPNNKGTVLRMYYTPLMSFVWLGFLLIAAGGALAGVPKLFLLRGEAA